MWLPRFQRVYALLSHESCEGGRQGKFWDFHDRLFGAPSDPGTLDGRRIQSEIGIDIKAYENCLESDATAGVRADMAAAMSLGISATPTFLFGGMDAAGSLVVKQREAGAIPFEAFAAIVDRVATDPDISRIR